MVASAGLNYVGGRNQAKAQQRSNDQQVQLGYENLAYQRERDDADRALLQEYNDKALEREKFLTDIMLEGYSDPVTGITTKYVPGEGWQTMYAPQAQAQIQADQKEQLLRTVVDQAASRRGRQANEQRRLKEGSSADATLAEMQGPDPYDSKRIIADLLAARRRGVNEGFDRSTEQVLTSNIRTGTASDRFLLDAAKERAMALKDAEAGAYTEGLGFAEDLRGARTSRLGNLYNTMATRASNFEDVPFAPSGLPDAGAGLSGRTNPAGANQNKVNPTTGRGAPTFDTSLIKPNLQGATNTYLAGQATADLGKILSQHYGSGSGNLPWLNDVQTGRANPNPWVDYGRSTGNTSY